MIGGSPFTRARAHPHPLRLRRRSRTSQIRLRHPHHVKEDSIGKLDFVSEKELTFDSPTGKLVIPYAAIESYEYSTDVTYHLGVAPAIVVGLVKLRKRQHFFRISFRDEYKQPQVAVFEVPK